MAMDMFLKFSDSTLKGESQDSAHKDEIQLVSWSWGAHNSATVTQGTGSGGGKVELSGLSFTKYVDVASAPLLLSACNGNHIADATLSIRKAGGSTPVDYLVIKMNKVFITSFQTAGSGGDDQLLESVSLNYGSMQFNYQQQDEKGAKQGGVKSAGWDQVKNIKV